MFNTELSAILDESGRLIDLSNKVKYKAELSAEDVEITKAIDAWAKDVGSTGHDATHELSAMIRKAITQDSVLMPSDLIDRLFDTRTIGEFDDTRVEKAPKNTIKVFESVKGGNVDRSYFDFTTFAPKWTELQAETEISLLEMRRGGYKTVTAAINFITEALEQKKLKLVMDIIDLAISSGADNYIPETGTTPSDAAIQKLALYLQDVTDGDTPVIFGLNKYIQSISLLPGVTSFLTDAVKNQYNTTGKVTNYAGSQLIGLSGQKRLADGSLMIPDKRLFGAGGKIGEIITRGETIVQQATDINSDKIHIKVNGFSFGTMITDISKAAKMVLA